MDYLHNMRGKHCQAKLGLIWANNNFFADDGFGNYIMIDFMILVHVDISSQQEV